MKKRSYIIFLALVLCVCALLVSCEGNDTDASPVMHTVTFDTQGGSAVQSQSIPHGTSVILPTEPEKEGYIFKQWEKDGLAWNFEINKVESDITLEAVWIPAEAIYNYTVLDNGNACLTKYNGDQSIIKVPSMINGLVVEALGDGLFSSVVSETVDKIIVADTVKSVGNNAFKDCADIDIEIRGTLSYIGENAFYGCTLLKSVKLGEGIEQIPFAAFCGCTSLKSITLPKGVQTISENAFEGCVSLVFVVVPEEVRTVEGSAFRDCEALVTVYYYGTEQSFDAISVATSYNSDLVEARLYLYSETEPEVSGEYWYYDERGNIRLWR